MGILPLYLHVASWGNQAYLVEKENARRRAALGTHDADRLQLLADVADFMLGDLTQSQAKGFGIEYSGESCGRRLVRRSRSADEFRDSTIAGPVSIVVRYIVKSHHHAPNRVDKLGIEATANS